MPNYLSNQYSFKFYIYVCNFIYAKTKKNKLPILEENDSESKIRKRNFHINLCLSYSFCVSLTLYDVHLKCKNYHERNRNSRVL